MGQSTSEDGTTIEIRQLHDGVAASFDQASGFVSDLRAKIASIYAIILDKGFTIYLNGDLVRPRALRMHAAQPGSEPGVRPYVWRGEIDGVQVRLAVGFRRQLAREAEIEEITEDEKAVRRSAEDAGWTVVCNDRIVLFNDRTERTGWGTMGVPAYHNQFISIAGIVSFETNQAEKLPVTTTKRSLDRSSMVYLKALEEMKKGLKKFTDFTNKWKGREEETTKSFISAPLVSATEILRDYANDATAATTRTGGQAFQPNLPQPPKDNQRRRIVFFRDLDDVERLARHFFDDPYAKPSEVGEAAFDHALGSLPK
jgi:hypothetical protein